MFNYEKRLQYPVNITRCDPKAAMVIISQYGGPDGEAGAALRYLSQRYSMVDRRVMGTLTDIGTEELGHLEIVATIIRQLTKILHQKKSKPPDLINIILTTHLPFGRRLQAVNLLVQASFRAQVIQSPTFTKIWRRNKKPV